MSIIAISLRAAGILSVALFVSACGHRHMPMHAQMGKATVAMADEKTVTVSALQLDLLRQDTAGGVNGGPNGVLDAAEKIQQIKACSTPLCFIDVVPLATALSEEERLSDCQIELRSDGGGQADILLLLGTGPKSLTWNLKPPAGSPVQYRFRPKPPSGSKSRFGVHLYADSEDPERQVFKIGQTTEATFVLNRGSRNKREGFNYGVYLDWKLPTDADFKPCIGLDPIIIEHN